MPRVPIVDSLKTPLGLFRQIHREEYSKYSLSDFLVTDLDLDGLDLGPLMNYMKEILYDRVEKHIDRGPRQIPIAVGAATAIFCHVSLSVIFCHVSSFATRHIRVHL
jgi:hypothetical protein